MTSSNPKEEIKVMVLTDLVAICKKLAENPAVKEELRVQARQFVIKFESLLPYRGRSTALQHFEAEDLLTRIARFLPLVLD